tara:strand:+ start:1228 stop:2985 length:1758 start_codon:yes stop_codon:yes gene_type:complete
MVQRVDLLSRHSRSFSQHLSPSSLKFVRNRPALQKELGAAADENIAIEGCADEDSYPGLACVIQVFFFDVKVGALPDPSTTGLVQTRTWNDYLFTWKWENQFVLARSRWLPLSTLIFDPYILMPKEVSDQLKAESEATLYEFMVKYLFFEDIQKAKAAVSSFLPLYPEAHLKSLLMAELIHGLPGGEENLGFKDQIYMYDMGPQYGEALPFQRMFLENTDWRIVQPAPLEFREALNNCEKAGFKHVVWTNAPRSYAMMLLETLDLRDYFPDQDTFVPQERYMPPRVFAVEDLPPDVKPELRAYKRVLAKIASDPYESAYVDNNLLNVRAAKRAGMRTVLVGGSAKARTDPSVDVAIDTVNDIFKALPSLGYEGSCADMSGLPPTITGNSLVWDDRQEPQCDDKRLRRLGAKSVASSSEWFREWQRRFSCWWITLPSLTRGTVGSCLGALSLHFGSRLDALRGVLKDGSSVPRATLETPKIVCNEWLSETKLDLPELPSLPDDVKFQLPPIPRLIPDLDYLRNLMLQTGQLSYLASNAQPRSQQLEMSLVPLAAGVGCGALVALAAALAWGGRRGRCLLRVLERPQ